jgi:hypothetical protein
MDVLKRAFNPNPMRARLNITETSLGKNRLVFAKLRIVASARLRDISIVV